MVIEHIRDAGGQKPDLIGLLESRGIRAAILSREGDLDAIATDSLPQLALLDVFAMSNHELRRCVQRCLQLKLTLIALVPRERLADLDTNLGIDDFVVSPPIPDELIARSGRALDRSKLQEDGEVIRFGDLLINLSTYEVSVNSRRINLRFKEFELLRLLANNPGRVYSREALLNQIWGYDYFGGTRTVDVHIRRLRSKIEDSEHSFIETIWNVGYRFKDLTQPF